MAEMPGDLLFHVSPVNRINYLGPTVTTKYEHDLQYKQNNVI